MYSNKNNEFMNLYHNLEVKLQEICPEYYGSVFSILKSVLKKKKRYQDANVLETMQNFRNNIIAHGTSPGKRPEVGDSWLRFLRKLFDEVDSYTSTFKDVVSFRMKKQQNSTPMKKPKWVKYNHSKPIGRKDDFDDWENATWEFRHNWDCASIKNFRERLLAGEKPICDLFKFILDTVYSEANVNVYFEHRDLRMYYRYGKNDKKFWAQYDSKQDKFRNKNVFTKIMSVPFKDGILNKYMIAEYKIISMNRHDIDNFSNEINYVWVLE